jgi:hypothetical protein
MPLTPRSPINLKVHGIFTNSPRSVTGATRVSSALLFVSSDGFRKLQSLEQTEGVEQELSERKSAEKFKCSRTQINGNKKRTILWSGNKM